MTLRAVMARCNPRLSTLKPDGDVTVRFARVGKDGAQRMIVVPFPDTDANADGFMTTTLSFTQPVRRCCNER